VNHLSQVPGEWSRESSEAARLQDQARVRIHGPHVKISVDDRGISIRNQDLKRIFDVFVQVDGSPSRRYQGTGLGLSLTRNLVELHGGRIWAGSQGERQGSPFTVLAVDG